MLPFLVPLPLWETDATGRAALQTSVANNLVALGQGEILGGGEAMFDARAYSPGAIYTFYSHGMYAHDIPIAIGGGSSPAADAVSAEVSATAGWTVAPLSRLSLDLHGYLASPLGVRAFDELAVRDPFLGDRLEYTLAPTLGWGASLDHRTSVWMTGGYVQTGALSAATRWGLGQDGLLDQSAVGVDSHEGVADLSLIREVGHRDFVTPELRYEYTHFYHELMNVELELGPANIQLGSALLTETHAFARRWIGTVTGGVTVATQPPLVGTSAPEVAPDVRAGLSYVGRSFRATASYAYEYASLGPRIGFGQTHDGLLEVDLHPVPGAKYRELGLRAIGRFGYGSTPVAANPTIPDGTTVTSLAGLVTTTTAAAGFALDVPIAKGITMTGGFDLEYENASFSVPAAGSPGTQLLTVVTFGIAGTLSTDPRRRVLQDMQQDDEREAERLGRPDATAAERLDEVDGLPGVGPSADPRTAPNGAPVPGLESAPPALPDGFDEATPTPEADPLKAP
jgi:hypothetical protein